MYKIDSCVERLKHRRYNVCNRPSFHTVCKRPIVNRNLLTPDDYLNMLSTPKGFLWTGITSNYKKNSTDSTNKLKTFNKLQRSNFQKSYKQENENYSVNRTKNLKNANQQKYAQIKNRKRRDGTQSKIFYRNKQNNQKSNDVSIWTKHTENSNTLHKSPKTKQLQNILKREYFTSNHLTQTNTQSKMNTDNETQKNGNTQIKIINRVIKNKYNNQNPKKFNDISISNVYSVDKDQFKAYNKIQNKLKNKNGKGNISNKKNDTIVHTEVNKSTKKYEKISKNNTTIQKEFKKYYKTNKNEIGNIFKNKNNRLIQNEKNKSTENVEKINENNTSIQNEFNKYNKVQNKNEMVENLINENESLIHNEKNDSTEQLKKNEAQNTNYFIHQQKQLWLRAEKKRMKREEKENKLKSSLQAKQKAQEDKKRKKEENVKLEAKRKQVFEENQRENNIEKEKMTKIETIGHKQIIEERAKVKNEIEKNLRLQVLELEAQRIIIEEEVWRNKINQEFALKMSYKVNSNSHALGIIPNILNNQNEHTIGKIGKKRLIDKTNNLLKQIQLHDQVFDPGNLRKQIINKELNTTKKRQIKLRKKFNTHTESLDNTKNTQILEIYGKCENQQKSKVLPKVHNKVWVNANEQCVLNKQGVPKYKKPDVKHCYSNILFNTVVCHWKNDVADMKTNMQKRRYNFIQNAIANKMWKH